MTPRADSWLPARTRLFPAARAPRRFLSDLDRQLLAFSAWRRSAAWLPELLAQRPQLLDAPLFGTTLAAAVQGEDVRAETPSPRAAAATPTMPAAPERQRRRVNSSNPLAPPRSAALPVRAEHPERRTQAFAPPPLPGESRTRVERSLLNALAGGIQTVRETGHPGVRLVRPRPPIAAERHLPVGAESSRLVQQLAHRLRRKTLATEIGVGSPRVDPSANAPAAKSSPDLVAQWALPLLGPRVAQRFLDAVLQASGRDAAELPPPPDPRRPAAASPAPDGAPIPKGQSSSLGRRPPLAKGGDVRSVGPPPPCTDGPPPRETAPWFSALRRGESPAAECEVPVKLRTLGGPETGSSWQRPPFPSGRTDQVPAPNPAPSPTTGVGMTPGREFFAALRQQRTPHEVDFDRTPPAIPGAAVDDLAELTAKLQRIFEEQARRHGIDV